MDNDEKRKRWQKRLKEAGLLDEVEDGWTLPDEISSDTTIHVEGSEDKEKEVSEDDKTAPFAVPVASLFSDEETEPDQTPISTLPPVLMNGNIEERTSFDANKDLVRAEAIPPKARATVRFTDTPADTDAPPAVVDVHGTKISVSPDSGTASEPPPPQREFTDHRPRSISGTPISIARDSMSRSSEPDPTIVDTRPSAQGKETSGSHKLRDSGWLGDGSGEAIDAMDLVHDLGESKNRHEQLRERFDVGDYSGCLELAEALIRHNPNDAEAIRFCDSAKEILLQMYESRIGSLGQVPTLAISSAEIVWHNLNPETGFVLSRIDGTLTYEDIIDISGLPRFDTFKILSQLLQDGIIE